MGLRDQHPPFVKVYGPELTDGRLTPEEKIVLFYLRLRCDSNFGVHEATGTTFMGWKKVAAELGMAERSVTRHASKLRGLGLLVTERRGYAKTGYKTIVAPSTFYDEWLFSMEGFKDLTKGKLEPAKVARLRSLDERAPTTCRAPARDEQPPMAHVVQSRQAGMKIIGEVEERQEQRGPEGRRRRPTSASDGDADIDLDSEISDIDAVRSAHGQRAALVRDGSSSEKKTREDQSRTTKVVLPSQDQIPEADDIPQRGASVNQRALGSLHQFFRDEHQRHFPGVKVARWSSKEFAQAAALLAAFDGDEALVRSAWSYVCEKWGDLTRRLKLSEGTPTIGFLLGFKNRVFPLVQQQRREGQPGSGRKISGTFDW